MARVQLCWLPVGHPPERATLLLVHNVCQCDHRRWQVPVRGKARGPPQSRARRLGRGERVSKSVQESVPSGYALATKATNQSQLATVLCRMEQHLTSGYERVHRKTAAERRAHAKEPCDTRRNVSGSGSGQATDGLHACWPRPARVFRLRSFVFLPDRIRSTKVLWL